VEHGCCYMFAIVINPVGVGSVQAEMCVSFGETCQAGPSSFLFCQQNIKASTFQTPPPAHIKYKPNFICISFDSDTSKQRLCFPCLIILQVFTCCAAIISSAARNKKTACQLHSYNLFPSKMLLVHSANLITPYSSIWLNCAVSPPLPLCCLTWREQNERSRGDHAQPAWSKPN